MGDGHGVNLKLSFVGANPQPALEPSAPVETNVSYFLGNDPAQWRPEVRCTAAVRYDELYPGIDLVLGGDPAGVLPWSLEARPGQSSSAVRLRVEGADSATLDGRLLRIETAAGELALPLPAAGFSLQVEAVASDDPFGASLRRREQWIAAGRTASLTCASRQPRRSALQHLPGRQRCDVGTGIAVDEAGSAYVTGYTQSTNFPTTPGAFDTSYAGVSDVFVAKLNPAGSGLVYATFLGGSTDDYGSAIAVDADGQRLRGGRHHLQRLPHHAGRLRPELQRRLGCLCRQAEPGRQRAGLRHLPRRQQWRRWLGHRCGRGG